MPDYTYRASREDGEVVTGELSADGVSDAIGQLEGLGLTVQSIALSSTPQPRLVPELDPAANGTTDSLRPELTSLERQFDTVMRRRDVLIPALSALASELPIGRARSDIGQLVALLGKARSTSDLRRHSLLVQWLPLLAGGFSQESSVQWLSDLIAGAARQAENRNRRRLVLAYPLIVIVIAAAVFAFLCVIVVPTFNAMFDEFGLILPLPTRIVAFVSLQLTQHPIRFLIAAGLTAAALFTLFRLWSHFALTTRWFGTFVAGNSSSVSAMSSLTSQLAELLHLGVALPDALWLAGQGCRHYHFKLVAERLARFAHDTGQPLSESPEARYLPANLIHALQAGPGGRPNLRLLRELSLLYGDRVAARIDWAGGATGPLAVVVVGLAIAFVVIALFTPLVSLISGLT